MPKSLFSFDRPPQLKAPTSRLDFSKLPSDQPVGPAITALDHISIPPSASSVTSINRRPDRFIGPVTLVDTIIATETDLRRRLQEAVDSFQPNPATNPPENSRPPEQASAANPTDPNEPSLGNCTGPVQIVYRYTRAELELRGDTEAPEDPA